MTTKRNCIVRITDKGESESRLAQNNGRTEFTRPIALSFAKDLSVFWKGNCKIEVFRIVEKLVWTNRKRRGK